MPNTSNDWLDQLWIIIDDTEKSRKVEALVKQHITQADQAAELRAIDTVFELSPTGSFQNWKPLDAFKFYERLKDYERQLRQQQKESN